MKKIVLLIVALLAFASASMADQLWYISQSEAKAAVELLQKQKYVLLYCGCCGGDVEMQYVKIEKVYTKTDAGYYIVVVDGVDANGNKVSEEVDLAYAHIQKKKKALCVGKALKLDCDPCVDNLLWQCPNF